MPGCVAVYDIHCSQNFVCIYACVRICLRVFVRVHVYMGLISQETIGSARVALKWFLVNRQKTKEPLLQAAFRQTWCLDSGVGDILCIYMYIYIYNVCIHYT